MQQTSIEWYEICNEDIIWQQLYYKRFPYIHPIPPSGDQTWKDIYKKSDDDSRNLGNIKRGGYDEKDKFKIAFVCGYSGSGRTALIVRLLDNYFFDEYDPTIQDQYCFYCDWGRKRICIDILDDAAQEEYLAIRDQTYRWADGFMLIFTLTNNTSLQVLHPMREAILRVKDTQQVPMVLVGCKSDLLTDRVITYEEINELARSWGCPYIETSALLNSNVKEVFKEILTEITKYNPITSPTYNRKNKKCTIS